MAVVGIAQERVGSPRADFTMGKHTIIRKFLVKTDNILDGPITVATAIGVPLMFSPYVFGLEFHPFCRVRSVDPQRLGPNSLDWDVTVTYETPQPKSAGGGDGGSDGDGGDSDGKDGTGTETDGEYENPELELPEVETHFETQQQAIYGCQGLGITVSVTNGSAEVTVPSNTVGQISWIKSGDPCTVALVVGRTTASPNSKNYMTTTVASVDQSSGLVTLGAVWTGTTGKATLVDTAIHPVAASNGEVFVPPPHMDQSRLVLTITRNESLAAPHPALSLMYQDAVNADPFWGASPGCVKINNITVRREVRQIAGGTVYAFLKASYVFHFQGSGWDLSILDQGSWYWYKASVSQLNPTPPPQKMKFLTDDKQPMQGLLDGAGGKLADGANPNFLTVRPYNRLPFAALNLPQTFSEVQ